MEYIHFGDILAIPFFFLLTLYFMYKKNKTYFEYILYVFSICGLIVDIYFTYYYVYADNLLK